MDTVVTTAITGSTAITVIITPIGTVAVCIVTTAIAHTGMRTTACTDMRTIIIITIATAMRTVPITARVFMSACGLAGVIALTRIIARIATTPHGPTIDTGVTGLIPIRSASSL